MMQNNDLISREALLDIVGKMPLDWECGKAVSDIYDIIKNAPSVDAVPVVRCKDCAYKVFNEASQEYYCNHAFGMYGEIKDNDFCSYGERRNDG